MEVVNQSAKVCSRIIRGPSQTLADLRGQQKSLESVADFCELSRTVLLVVRECPQKSASGLSLTFAEFRRKEFWPTIQHIDFITLHIQVHSMIN